MSYSRDPNSHLGWQSHIYLLHLDSAPHHIKFPGQINTISMQYNHKAEALKSAYLHLYGAILLLITLNEGDKPHNHLRDISQWALSYIRVVSNTN